MIFNKFKHVKQEDFKAPTIEEYSYETFIQDFTNFYNSIPIKEEGFLYKKVEVEAIIFYIQNYFSKLIDSFTFDIKNHFYTSGITIKQIKKESNYFKDYIEGFVKRPFERSLLYIKEIHIKSEDQIFTNDFFDKCFSKENQALNFFLIETASCDKCGDFFQYFLDLKELKITVYENEDKDQSILEKIGNPQKLSFIDKLNSLFPTKEKKKLEPCLYESIKDYSMEINVPSKKIIISNHFIELLDYKKYSKGLNINFYGHKVEQSRRYEEDQIIYTIFVDAYPILFKNKTTDNIEIRSYNEDMDRNTNLVEVSSESVELKQICIMDYEVFSNLLKEKGMTEEEYKENKYKEFMILDVDTDRLKLTTEFHETVANPDYIEHFATMESL